MNQNLEQIARDRIDAMLMGSGWVIQHRSKISLSTALGLAVQEYPTGIGPADYLLFVDKNPVGGIEAKRVEEGVHLTVHEDQTEGYPTAKLRLQNNEPLFFGFESTGEITCFTDYLVRKPRRPVFSFHRPGTFATWLKQGKALSKRLHNLPLLSTNGLRECQINATTNLEVPFRDPRPKALIQMATGSGKTFTILGFIYRLLKYANAGCILFLVDTKNLGEQAEQKFMSYLPNDNNCKFTAKYIEKGV